MKKRFIYTLLILFAATSFSYAQEKTDKYCVVTVKKELGYRVSIDMGTRGTYFKDSSLTNNLKAITSTKNDVDLLDEMSRLGWTLASSEFIIQTVKQVFYFKKAFDKDQFLQGNSSH